eukprot:TRINITY_DN66586_c0_g1_i1.p1 TRINITY_DN66586_c0_g1~~TRINITY_DN66586_c0_g1_i1.p1  ORF type:complete len:362 (+),score=182.75 TRINITY_DN66586_c0_g1_i1:101-1087(+)
MAEAARMEEAKRHIKAAEKKLKKSITKWSVSQNDYDQAAMEFEQAAKIYQHAKKHLAAVDTWEKAAQMHEKADNLLFSGRAYDTIAVIWKDNKEPLKQAEFIQKAGDMYLQDAKPDKYADALVRAAKVLRDAQREKEAAGLIEKALDTLARDEKWHFMPEPGRTLVSIHVKGQDYSAAAAAADRCIRHFAALEQPHNVVKCCLEIVTLHLARNDHVLAERECGRLSEEHASFPPSEEGQTARDLLEAFDGGDPDEVKEVTKRQIFSFLHPDVARLARKITPSGPIKKKKPAAPPPGEAAAGGGEGSPTAHADPTADAVDSDDDLEALR